MGVMDKAQKRASSPAGTQMLLSREDTKTSDASDDKANAERCESENSIYPVGRRVRGKGTYVGILRLDGIEQAYHVFAAPEDMRNENGGHLLATFKSAAQQVSMLKNWHGRDGALIESEADLVSAIKNGTGVNVWFIPPREILDGKNAKGEIVRANTLFDLRKEGDFSETFVTVDIGSGHSKWYWSCTQAPGAPGRVWNVSFESGTGDVCEDRGYALSCRPCYIEPVEAPEPSL
ncbi:MAG: hypothetical protein PHE27_05100 [Alphaproteobacteria bacterium]|nr:hypothetical protein [Alphaproteobacteria bacterium]